MATFVGTSTPLPKRDPRLRAGLPQLCAFLALAPDLEEVLKAAERLDLRDLSEYELAFLEGLSVKTVQKWRQTGAGPDYRNEAGIRYPLRWYLAWREGGRRRSTKRA